MFFKNDRTVETKNIRLAQYEQVWTKFCFMDETGNLQSDCDPFFTIGMCKVSQPYYLQRKVLYERNKRNFHDEMKFNKLSKNNIDFALFAVNAFFDTRSIDFYSYTTNKNSQYYQTHFGDDPWHAYEEITLKLLDATLAEKEILILKLIEREL